MTAQDIEFQRRLLRQVAQRAKSVSSNLDRIRLLELAAARGEGSMTPGGAIVVGTAPHTGRSPDDKFIVRDALTRDQVWWENAAAMTSEAFEHLLADMLAHLEGRAVFSQSLVAGHGPHGFGVEVITETAWHALFIANLLAPGGDQPRRGAGATVLHLPSFRADPGRHGTRSRVVIALDMKRRLVLIGGTAYAGEIKKSVFSVFNFHAPLEGVLPMHCSANVGSAGDTALFFGLSGTGKTTLSNSADRLLLGDDEHGWSEDGTIFNLEAGCYAKTARLSPTAEPAIHAAALTRGTVLENVAVGVSGLPDFDDISLTENGRAAYPLSVLSGVQPGGTATSPRNVILLSADAFGVLPPIARLAPDQAVYFFLCGYTAKLAGTERGVIAPQATFSPCFGAPFISHHPTLYGAMLRDRLRRSGAACWLVNTGWTGGAYGTGARMPIAVTRRLVAAVLSGELSTTAMRADPLFGLAVPRRVNGIESRLLTPRETWAEPLAYDAQAEHLLQLFGAHMETLGSSAVAEFPSLPIAAE
jgi:phosphoenolpyruvate carboxykinase (ATP)